MRAISNHSIKNYFYISTLLITLLLYFEYKHTHNIWQTSQLLPNINNLAALHETSEVFTFTYACKDNFDLGPLRGLYYWNNTRHTYIGVAWDRCVCGEPLHVYGWWYWVVMMTHDGTTNLVPIRIIKSLKYVSMCVLCVHLNGLNPCDLFPQRNAFAVSTKWQIVYRSRPAISNRVVR